MSSKEFFVFLVTDTADNVLNSRLAV